jgi:isoleucyl-tRNA synthetase
MASELRFKNNDVKEVLQTVIIPLTNSLSFFEEYYKLYTIKNTFKNIDSDLPFDKWILTKTYDFLSTYTSLLNDYKINPINDLLVKYIDDLNNNYIKYNRDIIKGKDEDDENGIKCLKALNTLQKVLTLLCVYLSPILPFFTESMHTRLNLKTQIESVHLSNLKDYDITKYNIIDDDTKMIRNLLNIVDMIRQIRNINDIQLTKPLKNIIIHGEDDNINLLKKVESYIYGEGNIMDIEWKNWEATTYEYKYSINMKNAGTLFKAKRKDFEQYMTTKTQEELENLYNGTSLLYEKNQIDSNLVTVYQIIPTNQEDGYKISEDLSNKLKIKLNIIMDETSTELYIAKLIATTFQKLRKLGGFHVYDNLRLVMKTNKYTSIVMKHQDYIFKTTRVNIEIIDDITTFNFYKEMSILDEICDMYLINK